MRQYQTELVEHSRGFENLVRFTASGEWGKFSEEDMLLVNQWCKDNEIGHRTSFDMFSCFSPLHSELLQLAYDGVIVGEVAKEFESKPHKRRFHLKYEHAKSNYDELIRRFGKPGDTWQIRSVNKVTVELSFTEAKNLTLAVLLWRQ